MLNPTKLNWHVVYTRPKAERKVALSVSELGIESYLPLQTVVRQWSDRKKRMVVPLFPNYVFVKVNDVKRIQLFCIKELVKFVSIDNKPVVIRENEIDAIRNVLQENSDVSSEEYFDFKYGTKVRVAHGPFTGLGGTIVMKKGKTRLVVKIDGLMKAFSFEIPRQMVEMAGVGECSYTSV
jgi:transcription antitermination factor NusG